VLLSASSGPAGPRFGGFYSWTFCSWILVPGSSFFGVPWTLCFSFLELSAVTRPTVACTGRGSRVVAGCSKDVSGRGSV
jgi:hypothetical protein